MRDYYQPRLTEYVLAGRKLPPVGELGERNLFQHAVTITAITPDPKTPGRVAVSVEVSGRDGQAIHPAQDLKLFRDGRMVAWHPGDNGRDRILALPGGLLRHTFTDIPLPAEPGKVSFTAYAFNADRVRSERATREYTYPVGRTQSRLFLVAMGVNDFDNPTWNLRYAANDARAFADILPRHLPVPGGAAVALLASGEETKPDRDTLRSLLLRLSGVSESGEPVPYSARSGPNDVVVLTVASHGLTEDDTFYILPADIPGKGMNVTPELLSKAVSADDLYAWLVDLDAKEIILILDTCESGAALGGEGFRPGPLGDRGFGQLAYDKAIRVLSATNENNAALEYDQLQHGLLSYALLREGLEKGEATKPGSEPSLRDWLAFGRDRTTEIHRRISDGEELGGGRGKVVFIDSGASKTPDRIPASTSSFSLALGQAPQLFDPGGSSALLSLVPLASASVRPLLPQSPRSITLPSYPTLSPAVDGRPQTKAHTVRVDGESVLLALQLLAPGKEVAAVRVDNVGGVSSLWRSDGKDGAANITVSRGGTTLASGGTMTDGTLGNDEMLLALSLKDNGAFAGKATDFRITVFFTDGQRAMSLLEAK
jgi:uncharacterized caspase-like protein